VAGLSSLDDAIPAQKTGRRQEAEVVRMSQEKPHLRAQKDHAVTERKRISNQ